MIAKVNPCCFSILFGKLTRGDELHRGRTLDICHNRDQNIHPRAVPTPLPITQDGSSSMDYAGCCVCGRNHDFCCRHDCLYTITSPLGDKYSFRIQVFEPETVCWNLLFLCIPHVEFLTYREQILAGTIGIRSCYLLCHGGIPTSTFLEIKNAKTETDRAHDAPWPQYFVCLIPQDSCSDERDSDGNNSACILSILRMKSAFDAIPSNANEIHDFTWTGIFTSVYAATELLTGITCCSLPALMPLRSYLSPRRWRVARPVIVHPSAPNLPQRRFEENKLPMARPVELVSPGSGRSNRRGEERVDELSSRQGITSRSSTLQSSSCQSTTLYSTHEAQSLEITILAVPQPVALPGPWSSRVRQSLDRDYRGRSAR